MRRVALLLALCLASAALPAAAGPWPREKGRGFLSVSVSDDRNEVYGEYGLGRGWTAGAKLAFSGGGSDVRPNEAQMLVWRGMQRGAGGAALSFGLAAGVRAAGSDGPLRPVGAAMLAWGHGFGGPRAPWVTAEAALERGPGLHGTKLDLTYGMRPGKRWLAMAQVQAGQWNDGPVLARLELSGGLRLGRAHLLVQPSASLRGPRDRRLRLSLWAEF